MKKSVHARSRDFGFTLVELMVSTAILAGLMILMLGTVDQTQRIWQRSTSKASQFQAARSAFESMSRRLSQATLNAYWRAYDVNIGAAKADLKFRRQSELQFLSGPTSEIFESNSTLSGLTSPVDASYPTHAVFFQAPLGYTEEEDPNQPGVTRFRTLDNMLSACGYFIEFGPDPDRPPFLNELPRLTNPKRFRLMELTVPGEKLNIYHRYEPVSRIIQSMIDPRVYDVSNRYYKGLVDANRAPVGGWAPPIWMVEGLRREQTDSNPFRFKYAHVRAENIIALVILPKVATKDRVPVGTDKMDLAPTYRYDSWRIISGGSGTALNGQTVDNSARDNILPPIVQVTMVAVDEPSMARMQTSDTAIPFTDGLFKKAEREGDYIQDLATLEKDLISRKANYRVFSTDIVIRGAKWSQEPKRTN